MTTQLSLFGSTAENPAPFKHVLPDEPTIHLTLKFDLPTRLLKDAQKAVDWATSVAAYEAQRFVRALLNGDISG